MLLFGWIPISFDIANGAVNSSELSIITERFALIALLMFLIYQAVIRRFGNIPDAETVIVDLKNQTLKKSIQIELKSLTNKPVFLSVLVLIYIECNIGILWGIGTAAFFLLWFIGQIYQDYKNKVLCYVKTNIFLEIGFAGLILAYYYLLVL